MASLNSAIKRGNSSLIRQKKGAIARQLSNQKGGSPCVRFFASRLARMTAGNPTTTSSTIDYAKEGTFGIRSYGSLRS